MVQVECLPSMFKVSWVWSLALLPPQHTKFFLGKHFLVALLHSTIKNCEGWGIAQCLSTIHEAVASSLGWCGGVHLWCQDLRRRRTVKGHGFSEASLGCIRLCLKKMIYDLNLLVLPQHKLSKHSFQLCCLKCYLYTMSFWGSCRKQGAHKWTTFTCVTYKCLFCVCVFVRFVFLPGSALDFLEIWLWRY